jgi:hypothetical protein
MLLALASTQRGELFRISKRDGAPRFLAKRRIDVACRDPRLP